jgi:hypothetical protein
MESELTSGKLRAVMKIDQSLIVVGIAFPTDSSLLFMARKLVY